MNNFEIATNSRFLNEKGFLRTPTGIYRSWAFSYKTKKKIVMGTLDICNSNGVMNPQNPVSSGSPSALFPLDLLACPSLLCHPEANSRQCLSS
jgi:hypothetical protein